jgi:hypothetical protein
MSKIDDFKAFVKDNPSLIKAVKDDKASWQKLYELWDVSGPEATIWEEYGVLKKDANPEFNFNDISKMMKNINLQTVQKGINNLQKAISFFQQLGGKDKGTTTESYVPRPIYKHFED